MSSRERKPLREPTQQDFESYRGGHTFKKWAGLPSDWHCPACKRSKFQLLTWTKSLTGYGGTIRGQYQWLAPIQEHHDHRADGGAHSPRFCATLICSDCNTADGKVKRLLKLPRDFSFSPEELGQIITGYAHCGIDTDLAIARNIYDGLFLL
jgi:hypothetical protein